MLLKKLFHLSEEKPRITVLFLMNEMFINNLESIYVLLKNDPRFSVVLCACEACATENRKLIPSGNIADYFVSNGMPCIDTYDYEHSCHIDLSRFKPDYIFVSTPYDIYRPEEYCSERLSSIAKLCDIEYGTNILKNVFYHLNFNDNTYYNNCYAHFVGCDAKDYVADNEAKNSITERFIPIGCLKVEKYLNRKRPIGNCWKDLFPESNALRIAWKPRWTVDNIDAFFDWLEGFISLINTSNNIQLLLLEHPFLRDSLKKHNMLEQYDNCVSLADSCRFCVIDYPDYLDYVLGSDILVCDVSSLVAEYSITGNPVFLTNCDYHELNSIGRKIVPENNVVHSFNEFISIINDYYHCSNTPCNNMVFYDNELGMSCSEYLVHWLTIDYNKVPMTDYYKSRIKDLNRGIDSIYTILQQGYYEESAIKNRNLRMQQIDKMLKSWSDEIMRLKSQ